MTSHSQVSTAQRSILVVVLATALITCQSPPTRSSSTVVLADIPTDCHTIAIRFSRRAPYHGNLSLWKPVDSGRIEVALGPEFAPHRYGVDAIHIECRNSEGSIVRMMDNSEAVYIRTGENTIDRSQFTVR